MSSTGVTCTHAGRPLSYVSGELDGYDLVEFTRHLQSCELCAEEVGLLRGAAEAPPLPAVEDQVPEQPGRARRSQRASLRALDGGGSGPNAEANAAAAREAAAIREATATATAGSRDKTGRRLLKQPVPRPAMFGFAELVIIGVLTVVLSHRAASISYVRVKAGWTPGGAALKLQGNQLELLVEACQGRRPAAATRSGQLKA